MRLLLTLYAAVAVAVSLPAVAAGPPLPSPFVPNTAQERAQTQLMMQQAQAQARLAASQARIQAQLDTSQARLEAQVAARQAGAQAQLEGAGQRAATTAALADLPLPLAALMQTLPQRPPGTMQLTALTRNSAVTSVPTVACWWSARLRTGC